MIDELNNQENGTSVLSAWFSVLPITVFLFGFLTLVICHLRIPYSVNRPIIPQDYSGVRFEHLVGTL